MSEKREKKPKNTDDMILDESFEQYAEEHDDPDITISNHNECYEIPAYAAVKDVKAELKRIRKDAKWLNDAADYVEHQLFGKKKAKTK